MKIIVMINFLPGLISHRGELIEELVKKNEVIVICPLKVEYKEKILEKIIIKDVNMDRRGKNIFKELKLIYQYYKILKEEKPDLILTYTIKPNIYGSIIAKILKISYINNITGLGSSFQKNNLCSKILKLMYKYSFSKSKCIFFQNSSNLDFFKNNKIINPLNQRIKLIPGSGVNLEKFYPIPKKRLDAKIKFLFIGRLMDEKGIKEYLECAKIMTHKNKNVEFQILGSFEEQKYEDIIKKLESRGTIKYLGTSKDVRKQIKNVDCIINPSWHEGMSNVLLEAGAMKKFLIASDIPGCNEIVINNITGFTYKVKCVIELEIQILKYLNLSREKKEEIIENCFNHIQQNFDRKKIIEEYKKIIQEEVRDDK
ncbi:glycosyltransferase family 4 protein [Cetobacterium sp.]|uniref:glycosyltransferase family 4 protein n=1 Tax=Cetobacterium sp. TaxID=2071632 RepID=UPI003EE681EF